MKVEDFLVMKKHEDVVGAIVEVASDWYTIHKAEKFTIILPADYDFYDLTYYPCIVSHTDTVCVDKPTYKSLIVESGVMRNKNGVLGADDRAGCYIIYEMVKNRVPAIYILTDEEECGGIGASACANSEVFMTIADRISGFIELDRRGGNDMATYGLDNSEFYGIFENLGYKEAMGSYTDVVDLGEVVGKACVNLSVGYYKEHTKKESLNLAEMEATKKIMLDLTKLEKLYEKEFECEFWANDDDDDLIPVVCDVCGDHAPLYKSNGMTLCDECISFKEDFWYE